MTREHKLELRAYVRGESGGNSEAARAAVMTVLREAADVVDSKCKGKVNRPGGRRAFSFGGVSPRR